MKATLSEIKKNSQGTNSEGKEARIRIQNNLEHKEGINIQPEEKEGTIILKNRDSKRRLRHISKRANIQIIGMPEGKEEDQEIENLFKK